MLKISTFERNVPDIVLLEDHYTHRPYYSQSVVYFLCKKLSHLSDLHDYWTNERIEVEKPVLS